MKRTGHVGGLRGGSSSNDAGRQVNRFSGLDGEASTLADASEDELRRLRDRGHRIHVCCACGLNTNKREEESQYEGKKRLSDVHVEQGRENGTAHDDARKQASRPPERGHAVLNRRQVFIVFRLLVAVAAEPSFWVDVCITQGW